MEVAAAAQVMRITDAVFGGQTVHLKDCTVKHTEGSEVFEVVPSTTVSFGDAPIKIMIAAETADETAAAETADGTAVAETADGTAAAFSAAGKWTSAGKWAGILTAVGQASDLKGAEQALVKEKLLRKEEVGCASCTSEEVLWTGKRVRIRHAATGLLLQPDAEALPGADVCRIKLAAGFCGRLDTVVGPEDGTVWELLCMTDKAPQASSRMGATQRRGTHARVGFCSPRVPVGCSAAPLSATRRRRCSSVSHLLTANDRTSTKVGGVVGVWMHVSVSAVCVCV